MKNRSWQISRRDVLRGLGAAIALPFLEAMVPPGARAAAQEAMANPLRLLVYYTPCGIWMPTWTPTSEGADYALSQSLAPLANLKDDLLVLSGVDVFPATDQGDGGGDHGRGTGSFLTQEHVVKTDGADIQAGVSADQHIAEQLRGQTAFSSLQVGIEGGPSSGDCDSGYSCAYSTNISWSTPNTPLAKEVDPQRLFDRVFSSGKPGETEDQRAKRLLYEQSILDFVKDDTTRLKARLGASDKHKLDEYLTGIRELEQQLALAGTHSCGAERPPAYTDMDTHIQLMSDLMVLALQCDLTRVITFMQANAGSNRTFPQLGISDGHHALSHHRGNPDKQAQLQLIDTWQMQMLAYLGEKMKATPAGDGNLLDSSLIFYSSEIADGQTHEHTNLPTLLLGKAGGRVTPGRHHRYAEAKPMANLLISIMQMFGVQKQTFGQDGTGPIDGLLV